jgi:hypothetical protein
MALFHSLLFIMSAPLWAGADIGFEKGSVFKTFKAQGLVNMSCGNKTAVFTCEKEVTIPSDRSHFYARDIEEADKVSLSLLDEDGERIHKSLGFDSHLQLSKGPFLLRGKTIAGKGILPLGRSTIEYSITHKNQVKESGVFDVYVEETAKRSCRELSLRSTREENCLYAINACDLYFHHSSECFL